MGVRFRGPVLDPERCTTKSIGWFWICREMVWCFWKRGAIGRTKVSSNNILWNLKCLRLDSCVHCAHTLRQLQNFRVSFDIMTRGLCVDKQIIIFVWNMRLDIRIHPTCGRPGHQHMISQLVHRMCKNVYHAFASWLHKARTHS